MLRIDHLSSLLVVGALAVPGSPALGQTTTTETTRTTTVNDGDRVDYDDRAETPYRTEYENDEDGDVWSPDAGDWELTLSGAGSNDQDFEDGLMAISLELSNYLTEAFSVGARQDVSLSDSEAAGTLWDGSSLVFAQFHFFDGPVRPFIGAGVGYIYGDGVADSLFAGPEAGLRWYVKPETFLFGRASYQFLFEESDDISDRFEDGRFIYTIGIGFTF